MSKYVCTLLLVVLCSLSALAQFALYDTLPYQKKKLAALSIASASLYTAGIAGLNELWYKENARQPFGFFNDNREWMQVDKIGHVYSSFYLSSLSATGINRCGVSAKKAALAGALVGFSSLLVIEVLDGYSAAYGASAGDLLANAGGSAFFWWQQHLWNEVRVQPKFSFHRTAWAHVRPAVLGDWFITELLKDYNGQTYWLAVDMDKFCRFPKWLNFSVGYGAQGMVYGRSAENNAAGFDAYRQYYLSVELDLSDIPTRSRALKTLFAFVSLIKFPAPALEISKKGWTLHPVYF
jgi:hypothetical protein